MGKSFVLKDRVGHTVGYAQQVQEKIRGRFDLKGRYEKDCCIYLFFADGKSTRFCNAHEGIETEWGTDKTQLVGVCIAAGRHRIADTDFSMERCLPLEANTENTMPEKKLENNRIRTLSLPRNVVQNNNTVFPERRWPPPCCTPAIYKEGKWIIEG